MSEGESATRTAPRVVGLSLRYLRAYRRQVLVALLTMVIDAAFTIALYDGLKTLINAVVGSGDHGAIAPTLAVLALLFGAATLANVARESLLVRVEVALADDLRLRMLGHLQALSPAFYERAGGDLLARFSGDVTAIKSALTKAFPTVVRYGLQAVGVAALLALLDWRLTALVALLSALTLALALSVAARAAHAARGLSPYPWRRLRPGGGTGANRRA